MADGELGETLSKVNQAVDEERSQQYAETVAHLRGKVSQLESQIKDYQKDRGAAREMAAQVVAAVRSIEPYQRVPFTAGTACSSPIAAVTDLSDLHIGEFIRATETEGFGQFDWEIAQRRMFDYAQNFIDWIATQRHAYRIDELHIIGKGDYISGDIHDELKVTNEFPLPMQTSKAGILVGEFVARLAPHFNKVRFIGVGADNHGRLNKKPQAKQKTANNMSFLVHTIAETYLHRHENVEMKLAEGIKEVVEIANHRFLIEHGDTIKGWMGIPYYGFERSRGREAVKRMGTDKDFHYISIGHWHVPAVISGNILCNGSLSGTSEYDHGAGRHAMPSQVSYLVHPKHGIFNWVAWKFKINHAETPSARSLG